MPELNFHCVKSFVQPKCVQVYSSKAKSSLFSRSYLMSLCLGAMVNTIKPKRKEKAAHYITPLHVAAVPATLWIELVDVHYPFKYVQSM